MLTYMLYATLKLSISETQQSKAVIDRVYDVVDIFLTFSYLLMLYGISDSVKRTIETQKQSREVYTKH